MAINFDTLKTSEDNIRKMFLVYYKHVIESQEYLLKSFKKNPCLTNTQYNKILANEKRSNKYEAELLDEAS